MNPSSQPGIELRIIANHLQFDPGESLVCEYEIDDQLFETVQTVETSVLWISEGKGDEDIGVHFFVRRTRAQLNDDRMSAYRFETRLPVSPLSYDGEILKIRWCVRVKLFCEQARIVTVEKEVRLGRVGIEGENLFRSDRVSEKAKRAH